MICETRYRPFRPASFRQAYSSWLVGIRCGGLWTSVPNLSSYVSRPSKWFDMSRNHDDQKELRLAGYWDARYAGTDAKKEGAHEWLRTFEDLKPFLIRRLPPMGHPPTSILHLGCGISVSALLYIVGMLSSCNDVYIGDRH